MAAAKPRVGVNAIVKFTPRDGQSPTEVTLKNSDWDIEEKVVLKECPNTSDGMIRAVGLEDYEGSFKGYCDDDREISTDIKAGTIGTLKLYRDKTLATYYQGVVVLESLKISTGVVDEEKWEAKFKKQSGVLYYPGTPPTP